MEVIFHIGMPKCASSTIQAHFADNDAYYASHGVLYPESYRIQHGYRHHENLFARDLKADTAVDTLLQEAKAKSCSKLVLSCERFSDDQARLGDLTTAFSAALGQDSVTVLGLIRDPLGLLRSSYAQFVKGGLWGINRGEFFKKTDASIDAYIDAFKTRWGYNWFDYDQILSYATKKATMGQQLVWDIGEGPDVVTRLCSHLQVENAPIGKSKNQRLKPVHVKFLRDFQVSYGQVAYIANKPALTNRLNFSNVSYSQEQAIQDKLDLPNQDVFDRFPDMDLPRQRLLKQTSPS